MAEAASSYEVCCAIFHGSALQMHVFQLERCLLSLAGHDCWHFMTRSYIHLVEHTTQEQNLVIDSCNCSRQLQQHL